MNQTDNAGSDRRAVLFDWDDTLCGAVPHRYDTIARVLTQHGHERNRVEVHRAWTIADDPVVDRVANGFWQRLQHQLRLDDDTQIMAALMAEFDRRETYRRNELFEDVQTLLDRLAGDGWILGVVSNNVGAVRRIAELELTARFATIVTPHDTGGVGKPEPAIFQVALDRMNVAPERTVYVGDTYEVDVLGARAAGLQAVLVDRMGLCDADDCEILPSLIDLEARLPIR